MDEILSKMFTSPKSPYNWRGEAIEWCAGCVAYWFRQGDTERAIRAANRLSALVEGVKT